MLKKIQIKNFQSHRDTTLKLSPGINGIIGDSISGKTAILRAIRWVAENRPRGFRFHSDFAKEKDATSIQLTFDDCKIKLSKNKSDSTYTIKEEDKVQSFSKFKTKVPDVIKNKINLSDINFQNQLDAHFLITSSGGKIAKAISHITQADKIIIWIQKITKELSTLKIKKKIVKKDIEEIDRKLDGFEELQELDKTISKIEKLQAKKEKIENEYCQIEDLLLQIEEVQSNIKEQECYIQAKPLIIQIEGLEQQLVALKQQKETIIETKQTQEDIEMHNEVKSNLIQKYIRIIKKSKSCPTCFGAITDKIIHRIEKEMSI